MPRAFHSARYGDLCRFLVAKRKAARVTQVDVALRLDRPQSHVAKYERGERRIDVIEFLDIAAAIGFDPAKLVSELVKPRPKRTGRAR
jgi:transcriptional regulator with XRE-family HTH domain